MNNLKTKGIISDFYYEKCLYQRTKNNKDERNYFSKNSFRIPNGELIDGKSFDDCFRRFKVLVANSSEVNCEDVFNTIQEFLLFSAGDDMMFKKKLEACSYNCIPIDKLIYPLLESKVLSLYSDNDIDKANPERDVVLTHIKVIVNKYFNLSSLLYYLYCDDFMFSKNVRLEFSSDLDSLIKTLDEASLTIGDFLRELVAYKCDIMIEIFRNIKSVHLREIYLKKIESLKKKKIDEVASLYNSHLPITYFYDHSLSDFLRSSQHLNKDSDDSTVKKNIKK